MMVSTLPSRLPGELDGALIVETYTIALEGLPAWAIIAGTKDVIRNSTFRPAPAELRQAALAEVRHESEMAKHRGKQEARPALGLPAPHPTREDTDKLNAYCAAHGIATRFNYDGTTYQA